jgi:hypothetical protein
MGFFGAVHAAVVSGKMVPAFFLPLLFPVLHLSYGAGLLYGLIVYGTGKRKRLCGAVSVRRVKAFGGGCDW